MFDGMLMEEAEELWFDYFAEADPVLPLPPEPTGYLPGSPERTAVVAWRALNGYQLWHPDDAMGREITSKTDHPCVTVGNSGFKVETHRTVNGKRRKFKRIFRYLDDALDWLDDLNQRYPSSRKRS